MEIPPSPILKVTSFFTFHINSNLSQDVKINKYEVKDVYIQKFNYFMNDVNKALVNKNYVTNL